MHARYIEIDAAPELANKARKAYEARREVLHYILHFKQEVFNLKAVEYDYSDCINELDSTVDNLRAQLEFAKYNWELKKLRNETRWWKEPVAVVALAAVLIGTCATVFEKCIKDRRTVPDRRSAEHSKQYQAKKPADPKQDSITR